MLTKGFAIDSVDKYGRTLLFKAVESENPEMVEFLLKGGIDINHVDDRGETVLFAAIEFENSKMVKLLLKHGVNVNQMNCVKYVYNSDLQEQRITALCWAAARDKLEVVTLLLDAGATTFKDGEDLLADFPRLQNYRARLYEKIRSLIARRPIATEIPDEHISFLLQVASKGYAWKDRFFEILEDLEKVIGNEKLPFGVDSALFKKGVVKIYALAYYRELLKADHSSSFKEVPNIIKRIGEAAKGNTEVENTKKEESTKTQKDFLSNFFSALPAEIKISIVSGVSLAYMEQSFFRECQETYLLPYLKSIVPEDFEQYISEWLPALVSSKGQPNDFEVWFQGGGKLDSFYSYDSGDESFSSEEDEESYAPQLDVPGSDDGHAHVFEYETSSGFDSEEASESYEPDTPSVTF